MTKQGKTKPINREELEKIELRRDGQNADRFRAFAKAVIEVPRDEILRREEQEQKTKKKGR